MPEVQSNAADLPPPSLGGDWEGGDGQNKKPVLNPAVVYVIISLLFLAILVVLIALPKRGWGWAGVVAALGLAGALGYATFKYATTNQNSAASKAINEDRGVIRDHDSNPADHPDDLIARQQQQQWQQQQQQQLPQYQGFVAGHDPQSGNQQPREDPSDHPDLFDPGQGAPRSDGFGSMRYQADVAASESDRIERQDREAQDAPVRIFEPLTATRAMPADHPLMNRVRFEEPFARPGVTVGQRPHDLNFELPPVPGPEGGPAGVDPRSQFSSATIDNSVISDMVQGSGVRPPLLAPPVPNSQRLWNDGQPRDLPPSDDDFYGRNAFQKRRQFEYSLNRQVDPLQLGPAAELNALQNLAYQTTRMRRDPNMLDPPGFFPESAEN